MPTVPSANVIRTISLGSSSNCTLQLGLAADGQHVERFGKTVELITPGIGGNDDFIEPEGNDGLVGGMHGWRSPTI